MHPKNHLERYIHVYKQKKSIIRSRHKKLYQLYLIFFLEKFIKFSKRENFLTYNLQFSSSFIHKTLSISAISIKRLLCLEFQVVNKYILFITFIPPFISCSHKIQDIPKLWTNNSKITHLVDNGSRDLRCTEKTYFLGT